MPCPGHISCAATFEHFARSSCSRTTNTLPNDNVGAGTVMLGRTVGRETVEMCHQASAPSWQHLAPRTVVGIHALAAAAPAAQRHWRRGAGTGCSESRCAAEQSSPLADQKRPALKPSGAVSERRSGGSVIIRVRPARSQAAAAPCTTAAGAPFPIGRIWPRPRSRRHRAGQRAGFLLHPDLCLHPSRGRLRREDLMRPPA